MGLRLAMVVLVVRRFLELLLGRVAYATARASALAAAGWKQRVLMTMPQALSASVQSRSAVDASTNDRVDAGDQQLPHAAGGAPLLVAIPLVARRHLQPAAEDMSAAPLAV